MNQRLTLALSIQVRIVVARLHDINEFVPGSLILLLNEQMVHLQMAHQMKSPIHSV